MLSPEEMRRYARQVILPEVGVMGQQKLRDARVLIVGAGGLGSPVALYLAAAGIGHLGLIDSDRVDESNLQRQLLHGTPDVGRVKVESARDTLQRLNPQVELTLHPARLVAENVREWMRSYEVIVDGTDNFPTRYLINDAGVALERPIIHGSVYRFEGQASVFAPHRGGPCYRCLFPVPPPPEAVPNCEAGGVLGVIPGVIGCIQATEVIKWILGVGESLLGRLLVFDALTLRFRELKLRRDPACPCCGAQASPALALAAPPVGTHVSPALPTPGSDEVSPQQLQAALSDPGQRVCVLDLREPQEQANAPLPGARPVPFSQLPQDYTLLEPTQTHYLVCRRGVRSRQAMLFLKACGFTQVYPVAGGLAAWPGSPAPDLADDE